ncbi:MAG: chemotaxis protein CheW, partial [Isosphaeraceae bacterium]
GSSATTGSRLIVLHNRERSESWIFGAEEVLGVHRLPRSQMRSVSSTLANPEVSFSQAIFSWEDRSVSFLDEQRLFAALRSIGQ